MLRTADTSQGGAGEGRTVVVTLDKTLKHLRMIAVR
jgi:hypothetical protein